jgi:hypothetical protein
LPYLLLAFLLLGTGLGIGLGLSEAPVAQAGVSHFGNHEFETCSTFSTPTDVGVRCTSTGTTSSANGIQAIFTTGIHIPKGQASCLPPRRLIARGPGALQKAIAYLRSRCLGG